MQKLAAAYKRVLALVFVGVFTSTVGQLAAHVSCSTQRGVEELWASVLHAARSVFFCSGHSGRRGRPKRAPDQSKRGIQRPSGAVPTYRVSRAIEGGQPQPSLYTTLSSVLKSFRHPKPQR